MSQWGNYVIEGTKQVEQYDDMAFTFFFQEAHLLNAKVALGSSNNISLGCQSVYREDIVQGGNFGAFTTNRPAKAAKALSCLYRLLFFA